MYSARTVFRNNDSCRYRWANRMPFAFRCIYAKLSTCSAQDKPVVRQQAWNLHKTLVCERRSAEARCRISFGRVLSKLKKPHPVNSLKLDDWSSVRDHQAIANSSSSPRLVTVIT